MSRTRLSEIRCDSLGGRGGEEKKQGDCERNRGERELEGKRRVEEERREDRENNRQKLQDPGRATDRLVDPTAVTGPRKVGVGDPCSGSDVDGAQNYWERGWVIAELGMMS